MKTSSICGLAVLLIAFVSLSACDHLYGNYDNPADASASNYQGHPTETATAIDISSALTVLIGNTKTLTVSYTPSNGATKGLIWLSLDTSIATVDASGNVRGIGLGTCKIDVRTVEGLSKSCDVTVASKILVTGVQLDATSASLNIGATKQLTATISPSDATETSLNWSSSNAAVATISTSGLITGVTAGTATITVMTTDGSYTNSCAVTVIDPTVSYSFDTGTLPSGFSGTWYPSTTGAYSGYSLHSPSLGNNAQATITLSGTVPAGTQLKSISFMKKVSSELNYDFLVFKNGNSTVDSISGTSAWTQDSLSLSLAAGSSYSFSWTYSKDVSISAGSDCAWIDNVVLSFGD